MLYASFAGQGFNFVEELLHVGTDSDASLPRYFLEQCFQTMKDEIIHLKSLGHMKCSKSCNTMLCAANFMEVVGILKRGELDVNECALSCPLIFATQIAKLLRYCERHHETVHVAQIFDGCIGHSEGIAAAAVLASSNTLEGVTKNALPMMAALLWMGILLDDKYSAKPCSMLRMDGISKLMVHQICKSSNALLSVTNFATQHVISGEVTALLHIHHMLAARNVNSSLLPVRAPFHNPCNSDILSRLNDLISERNLHTVLHTKVSLFPSSLGMEDDIFASVFARILLDPIDWPVIVDDFIRHKTATAFACIIDFGPECGVTRLFKKNLFDHGCMQFCREEDGGILPFRKQTTYWGQSFDAYISPSYLAKLTIAMASSDYYENI